MTAPRDIVPELRDALALFADAPMAALLQRAIDTIESTRRDRLYMTTSAEHFASETERLQDLVRRTQMQVNKLSQENSDLTRELDDLQRR